MVKKKYKDDAQLSLFESNEPTPTKEPTTVLEFVRARFEKGPEMTQEEYKRWIKILVNNSLKSMD
jgi:hypothetical protein